MCRCPPPPPPPHFLLMEKPKLQYNDTYAGMQAMYWDIQNKATSSSQFEFSAQVGYSGINMMGGGGGGSCDRA